MLRIIRLLAFGFALFAGLTGTVFAAAPDTEIKEKIINGKSDDAAGAMALTGAMQDCAARIGNAGRNPLMRRPFELLMREAQDAAIKMVSPEAQKVFAGMMPRMTPDALVTLLYALKLTPANADVDAVATKLLVPGMEFRVRTGLIDVLGAHRYAPAQERIALGLDPVTLPSVQIATCRALAALPDKKSIPALIKYMISLPAGKGGRFIYEATGALRTLTGQTFAANPADWKKWWEANQNGFVFDGSKSLEPDYNYELSEKQELEYYEVPVVENRLVIVLDTSGSMQMGGKPSRLESAKMEMKNFVKSLPEKTLFNIVSFSSTVKRWRMDSPLVAASEANKKSAFNFIDAQVALGGTATTLAMEEVLRDIAVVNGCETVYLVTDGNPNPWAANITAEQQERLMTWINQSLKIRINTIGIYSLVPADEKFMAIHNFKEDLDKMKKFLYDLASNNDGVYREVGKDGTNKVVKVEPKKEKAIKEKEEKEKAEKAAKEKTDKEKADKDAADKAKDKDAKPDPAAPKDKAADPPKLDKDIDVKKLDEAKKDPAISKENAVEPPKSDKDIDLIVRVKKPEDPKKDPPKAAKDTEPKKDE